MTRMTGLTGLLDSRRSAPLLFGSLDRTENTG